MLDIVEKANGEGRKELFCSGRQRFANFGRGQYLTTGFCCATLDADFLEIFASFFDLVRPSTFLLPGLYLLRQKPCQCVNATLPCASAASKTAPTVAEVDAGGSALSFSATLTEGVWFNSTITDVFVSQYFKFDVPASLASSCPIITVEIQTQIGEIATYVSAQTIPNLGNNDFARPGTGVSNLVICPTQPNFFYGTYYVTMQSQQYDLNIYAIRYTIAPSPTCLATSAASISAHANYPSAPGSTWLQDGIKNEIEVPANTLQQYEYFQLYTEGQCAFVSAAVHSTVGTDMLSSLYVIANDDIRANETSVARVASSWTIPHVATASINFRYCNPSATATSNIFYIGVKFGQTLKLNDSETEGSRSFQLVATAQQYTPAVPLTSFGYLQSKIDLSFGAAPTITCGTAQSRCQRYAYELCIADYIGCCDAFFPIPPEEEVQAVWPWNPADTTVPISFYGEILWQGMQPLVEGKLAWAIYMHSRTPNGFTVVMPTDDPSSCSVELAGRLVNSAGQLPNEAVIAFSQLKSNPCDLEEFQKIDDAMDESITQMLSPQSKLEIATLALHQLELTITSWDDDYDSCKNQMANFANLTVEYVTSYPGQFCTSRAGSDDWLANPCCNPELWATKKCTTTTVNRLVHPDGVMDIPKIEKQCASPTCALSYVDSYLDNMHHLVNERAGCLHTYYQVANPGIFANAQEFSIGCRRTVDPTYTMASVCVNDNDCFGAATCNATTKRCNNTEDLLLECIAKAVPLDTAVALYNMWGIEGEPTADNMLNGPIKTYPGSAESPVTVEAPAISAATKYPNSILAVKWFDQQCVGPTARLFRAGYQYARADPTCVDDCLVQGLEPFCLHHTANGACPLPTICNRDANGSTSVCHRTWVPVELDLEGCASSEICNWRANETYPCVPQENQSECAAKCESSIHSDQVCLDCSRSILGTCLEVSTITDATTCNQGLCATDTTSSDCASTGVCTLPCGAGSAIDPTVSPLYPNSYSGCASQAACESSRRCSDFEMYAPLSSTQDGICLLPFSWLGFYSSCPTGWTSTTYTCANFSQSLTEANCAASEPGAYWYTFSTSEDTCTGDQSVQACFWTVYNFWTARTEDQCDATVGMVWTSPFTWKSGNWTAGYVQPLVWTDRAMIKPNEVRTSFDYQRVYDDVRGAAAQQFSYAYYTNSLCRFGATADLISVVVCNCQTDGGSKCFDVEDKDDFSDKPNGQALICPYQSRTLSTQSAQVTVPATAMPTSTPCTTLNISSTPIGTYATPADSSAARPLFSKDSKNPFLVIENDYAATVGQIMSEAIIVSYDFTTQAEMQLCIFLKNLTVEDGLTVYRIAKLHSDKSIRVVDDKRITVEIVERSNAETVRDLNSTSEEMCGFITEPGTYFAAIVIPDYLTEASKMSAQSIASLIFYIALFFFAAMQLVLLILDRDRQRLLPFKIVALSIIMLTVIARIIAIQPNNIFSRGDESVEFIVYELPTFFYFSVFTVIVYLWLLVVITTNNFGNRRALDMKRPLIRHVFISLNLVMYAIFIVFIYLLAILPGYDSSSPCFKGDFSNTTSKTARSIKIAYWVVQLVISLTLALGFASAAVLLLRIVQRLRGRNLGRTNGSRTTEGTTGSRTRSGTGSHTGSRTDEDSIEMNGNSHHSHHSSTGGGDHHHGHSRGAPSPRTAAGIQMIIITTVAITCIVFLVIRAAVFLYYAYAGGGLPVIVFCLLEVIPQTMLVFYLHPFRCFREAGRSSTTSKGSRGSRSTGGLGSTYRHSTAATGTSNRVSKENV